MKIFFSRTVKLYLYVILIKHSFNYIFIFIFDVASSVHCERIDVCKRCHSSFECMTHFTFLLMEFRYYNRSSNAATYNFINKNSEREKEKKGRKKKMLWISIISMCGAMCDKYCDTDNRVNDVVLFFIVEWKHVFFRFNLLLFALNAMERKKEIAKSAFFFVVIYCKSNDDLDWYDRNWYHSLELFPIHFSLFFYYFCRHRCHWEV